MLDYKHLVCAVYIIPFTLSPLPYYDLFVLAKFQSCLVADTEFFPRVFFYNIACEVCAKLLEATPI